MHTVQDAIDALAPPETARQIEISRSTGGLGSICVGAGDDYTATPADYDRWLRALAQELRQLPTGDGQALERLRRTISTELRDVLGPNQWRDLNRPESEGLVRLVKRRAVWALYQRVRHRTDTQGSRELT